MNVRIYIFKYRYSNRFAVCQGLRGVAVSQKTAEPFNYAHSKTSFSSSARTFKFMGQCDRAAAAAAPRHLCVVRPVAAVIFCDVGSSRKNRIKYTPVSSAPLCE